MKLTVRELIGGQRSLGELGELKLPVKVSYKIARVRMKLEPEYRAYYDARDQAIRKYGKLDKKVGWQIKPDDQEAMDKFNEEMEPVLDAEIELDVNGIPLEELPESIEPRILADLFWMIEEVVEKEENRPTE